MSISRVAALYDIHGNLPALEAVLRELEEESVGTLVIGGDVVPGPFPREVVATVLGLGDRAYLIRGNGERELAEPPSGEDEWAHASRWVASQFTEEEVRAVVGWPQRVTLTIEELGLTLFCHATPRSDEEIITHLTPAEAIAMVLDDVSEAVVVCGHTHSQYDRRIGSMRVVNPGSVGMPYESEPGAYWALLGPGVELRRTSYDPERAADLISASAFPLAQTFATENVLTTPTANEAAETFERMRHNPR